MKLRGRPKACKNELIYLKIDKRVDMSSIDDGYERLYYMYAVKVT